MQLTEYGMQGDSQSPGQRFQDLPVRWRGLQPRDERCLRELLYHTKNPIFSMPLTSELPLRLISMPGKCEAAILKAVDTRRGQGQ